MVIRAWVAAIVLLLGRVAVGELPSFEFVGAKTAQERKGNGDVAELMGSEEGLVMVANGRDPFITGPARDFPTGQLLSLHLRIKSEEGGEIQVFYFKDGAREAEWIKA